jgi:hypothetical protein
MGSAFTARNRASCPVRVHETRQDKPPGDVEHLHLSGCEARFDSLDQTVAQRDVRRTIMSPRAPAAQQQLSHMQGARPAERAEGVSNRLVRERSAVGAKAGLRTSSIRTNGSSTHLCRAPTQAPTRVSRYTREPLRSAGLWMRHRCRDPGFQTENPSETASMLGSEPVASCVLGSRSRCGALGLHPRLLGVARQHECGRKTYQRESGEHDHRNHVGRVSRG